MMTVYLPRVNISRRLIETEEIVEDAQKTDTILKITEGEELDDRAYHGDEDDIMS